MTMTRQVTMAAIATNNTAPNCIIVQTTAAESSWRDGSKAINDWPRAMRPVYNALLILKLRSRRIISAAVFFILFCYCEMRRRSLELGQCTRCCRNKLRFPLCCLYISSSSWCGCCCCEGRVLLPDRFNRFRRQGDDPQSHLDGYTQAVFFFLLYNSFKAFFNKVGYRVKKGEQRRALSPPESF